MTLVIRDDIILMCATKSFELSRIELLIVRMSVCRLLCCRTAGFFSTYYYTTCRRYLQDIRVLVVVFLSPKRVLYLVCRIPVKYVILRINVVNNFHFENITTHKQREIETALAGHLKKLTLRLCIFSPESGFEFIPESRPIRSRVCS